MEHHKKLLMKFWHQHFHFSRSEIEAFLDIDRAKFVLSEHLMEAYQDVPLPILREKTITQPTTVMIMTHALDIEEGNKILEVGSGSGYQAAILGHLVGPRGKVYSTEILPELVQYARRNCEKFYLKNVDIIEQDGSKGLEKHAPFDRIIVTASCFEFPPKLLEQLKPGGVIIGPVGSAEEQEMVCGTKDKQGRMSYHFLGQFVFSSMYGKYGFNPE